MPTSNEMHSDEALVMIVNQNTHTRALRDIVSDKNKVAQARIELVRRAGLAWDAFLAKRLPGTEVTCLMEINLGMGRYVTPNVEHVKHGWITGWLCAKGVL